MALAVLTLSLAELGGAPWGSPATLRVALHGLEPCWSMNPKFPSPDAPKGHRGTAGTTGCLSRLKGWILSRLPERLLGPSETLCTAGPGATLPQGTLGCVQSHL